MNKQLNLILAEGLMHSGVRHFSAAELLELGASHGVKTADGFGLNTLPPRELLPNLVKVALLADAVRDAYGKPLIVVSAYRSPAYNRALSGAASRSFHLRAMALDIAPANNDVRGLHAAAGPFWGAGGQKRGVGGQDWGGGGQSYGIGYYRWGIHVDIGPMRQWGKARS